MSNNKELHPIQNKTCDPEKGENEKVKKVSAFIKMESNNLLLD